MPSDSLSFAAPKKKSESIPKSQKTVFGSQTAKSHKVQKNIQKRKTARKGIVAAALQNNIMADQDPQESQPAVKYQDLKAWIAAQEKLERETSKPAPLTEAQRQAVKLLKLPGEPPAPEPELGDTDWVSVLKNYRDAHPKGQLKYTEEPVAGGDKVPRWAMKCNISESESAFPSVSAGKEVVSFARKKDAKKYAAKCTVEWLIEKKLMPENGSVTFPKAATMPALQSLPTDAVTGTVDPDLDIDNSMPSTQRVPALCTRLGLQPPSYVLQPNPDIPSLFSGWAEFSGGMQVPTRLGHVSDIYTKKGAKEKIASLVVQHLLIIEAERTEQADKLIQSM